MKSIATKIINGNANTVLVGIATGLFVAYSFFIVSTVVAINQRKSVNTNTRALQSRISDLEIRYFTVSSGIDISKASEMGFVNAQTPTFAYVQPEEEKVAMVR